MTPYLKLDIHEKARLRHLSQYRFFPPIQVERLRTSFTDAPKSATAALRPPTPPLPHGRFNFSSLVAWSQSRQNLCSLATLAARPSIGNPAIPI
ncbi:hypothetical protein AVEN_226381-1 [Araneus ventricosus]|uniref:Uncharacterized protein n=1 Tax=Araneus ventricosus TaxID=182803 RepID=A0A4Y2VWC4_ARAVE|nr:hypothetical protein AVEN_181537-1 [Araneus ventricosus]GBO28981.1 hypothetical protein AVEN_226381-1 [Araneus ventricosus]